MAAGLVCLFIVSCPFVWSRDGPVPGPPAIGPQSSLAAAQGQGASGRSAGSARMARAIAAAIATSIATSIATGGRNLPLPPPMSCAGIFRLTRVAIAA